MGIGIALLLWATVGGFVLAAYLLLSRLQERSPIFATLKDVVAAGTAVVIPLALWVIVNFALNLFPHHVFKSSFGFPAPPDVADLRGERSAFGDGGTTYLRFRAGERTVRRIIEKGFVEVDVVSGRQSVGQLLEFAPGYWRPSEGSATRFYESTRFDENFSSSAALLVYDEASGVAHFYWSGID